MRVKRKSAIYGESEDTLPLADGVAEFLKTEEAKVFLPAPQGSSSQPLPRSSSSSSRRPTLDDPNASPLEFASELQQALNARMGRK